MENHKNKAFLIYLQQIKSSQSQELSLCNDTSDRFPKFHASITAVNFWNLFLTEYEILNQTKFIISDESKTFVFTIIYFFLRDKNFYRSPSIYKVDKCETSLNKGLFVVGGYGVGKSSIVKTIVLLVGKLSFNNNLYCVKFHNTSDIVEEFENSITNYRNDTINRYSKGFRVFDDVKNERQASNFGKVDLFKDIFYKRFENRNYRTIIICNYDSQYPSDMQKAIDSFERYGDRNYDRLFEAFNFVEFKGTSNRK